MRKVNFEKLKTRPREKDRLFVSETVEKVIKSVGEKIADKNIRRMFEQCLPNTLDTTVYYKEDKGGPDTFISTGDIPAMWLRDSTNQVWVYKKFIGECKDIKNLYLGL